jgi:hypothetical protein
VRSCTPRGDSARHAKQNLMPPSEVTPPCSYAHLRAPRRQRSSGVVHDCKGVAGGPRHQHHHILYRLRLHSKWHTRQCNDTQCSTRMRACLTSSLINSESGPRARNSRSRCACQCAAGSAVLATSVQVESCSLTCAPVLKILDDFGTKCEAAKTHCRSRAGSHQACRRRW